MADVYGAAGKNSYPIPGVVGSFSNTVNKTTGVSQVYIQGPLLTQQSVGTFNPSTGKFTPDANSTLTQQQITKISSDVGLSAIKTASNTTVTKDLVSSGTNPQTAQNQANQLLSKNKATGGTVTGQQITESVGGEVKNTRNKFGGGNALIYPLGLQSEHQDVIKFKMVRYAPRTFNQQNLGFSDREKVGSTKEREIIGTTILPVPAGISDANAVSWASDNMNALQIAGAATAMGIITEGGEGGKDALDKIVSGISGASEDVKTAITAAFTQQAVGVTGLLSRTSGLIINPNMELLFNSPTLRPFNFTFKLSARSKKEAERIRSIIRFFKQGMSPIRTQSNLFLKAPHTFQLEYLHRGNPHPYLNKFKECALQSFSVDYTPEGQYATFTDGAMVSYQITMQFQELEPVFNDDYGNSEDRYPDPDIGY